MRWFRCFSFQCPIHPCCIHILHLFTTFLLLLTIFFWLALRGPTRTNQTFQCVGNAWGWWKLCSHFDSFSMAFFRFRQATGSGGEARESGESLGFSVAKAVLHVENPLVVRVWNTIIDESLYVYICVLKNYFFKARQIWCRCLHSWIHIHISNVFVGSPTVLMPLSNVSSRICTWQAPIAPWRAMEVQMVQPWDTTRRCQFSKQQLGFCEGEMLRWKDVVLRIFWWQQMAWKQLEFFRIEWDSTKVTKHWWYNDFLFSRKFSCSTSRCISFPRDEHRNFLSLPFEHELIQPL